MSAAPEISVVIPTLGRETRLSFALDALAGQSLEGGRFEVIVVRAAVDEPGELATAPPGLRVTFLEASEAGAAIQRNLGWSRASAPLIAFTDDDCRPNRDWLRRLLEAAPGPGEIIQGRTEPDPDERHLLHGLARTLEVIGPDGWYPTCNMLYPRELLERIGGFDESFPRCWGEDTDLGLRAIAAGARVRYDDQALVWHAVHARNLKAAIRDAIRYEHLPAVLARHPGQRRELHWGVFLRKRHAKLLLALAGLAFWRRHPLLAALAIAPWVEGSFDFGHLGVRGIARQMVHLPARGLVDATETAVTAREAIRERVLVL